MEWSWFSFVIGGLVGLGAMWVAVVIALRNDHRHDPDTWRY